MPELIAAEEHSQVYDVWRERGQRSLAVTHVDFHCDMRGLYIDRQRGRAWLIDAGDYRVRHADSGNYLGHAIVEGIVTSVRWVHDSFGGRRYDVGTVKYETDLTALPHRLLHRLRGGAEAPIAYQELTMDAWQGPLAGEQLDIDWDGIASIDYDDARIRRLMEQFLALDFPAVPETTYVVYSPGYSHPDRALYEEFLARLGAKLGATLVRLPAPAAVAERSGGTRFVEAVERAAIRALHRVGIY